MLPPLETPSSHSGCLPEVVSHALCFGEAKVDGDFRKPPSTGWGGWKHHEIADLAIDVYRRIWVSYVYLDGFIGRQCDFFRPIDQHRLAGWPLCKNIVYILLFL